MRDYLLIIFLFPFFILSYNVLAQENTFDAKWGKISEEEISFKKVAFEPSATAVNLFRNGKMYFNTNAGGRHLFLIYEKHTRIKFLANYSKQDFKVTLPYYDYNSELRGEYSIKIKAQAFYPGTDGKLQKKKIRNSEIQHKRTGKYQRTATIIFSNIVPGTIIEYLITQPSLDFEDPKDWVFQDQIPTLKSKFEAVTPEVFQYLLKSVNVDTFDYVGQQALGQTINWYGRANYYPTTRSAWMTANQRIKTIRFNSTKYSFGLANIPSNNATKNLDQKQGLKPKMMVHLVYAERKETNTAYIGSIYSDWEELTHHLVSSLQFRFDSLSWDQRKNQVYPSGYILYQLPNWQTINHELLKSKNFGFALRTYWEYKGLLDSLIHPQDDEQTKMVHIYNFVQNHMTWNGKYAIFLNADNNPDFQRFRYRIKSIFSSKNKYVDQTLYKPYLRQKGTSSEINMLLIYLLKKARLEVDPVLISTADNGTVDTSLHIFSQLNHVICRVKIDNQVYYLDAIDKDVPYYLLPENSLNGLGLLIRYRDPHWVHVKNSRNSSFESTVHLNVQPDQLYGQFKNIYKGYNARNYDNGPPVFIINMDVHVKELDKKNGKLEESGIVQLAIDEKRISFSPLKINKVAFFDSFQKNYPFVYNYLFAIEHNGELKKYKLPKSINYTLAGRKYSFIVFSEEKGNALKVRYQLTQSYTNILNNEKAQVDALYHLIESKLNDKIELELYE